MALSGSEWNKFVGRLDSLSIPKSAIRPQMKTHLYALPQNENFDEMAAQKLLTFVFVRNPFDRFAAAYYDVMLHDDWSEFAHLPIFDIRNAIIKDQRGVQFPEEDMTVSPTPIEMVRFILQEFPHVTPPGVDIHFRPQWASCPFCRVDFDLVGRMETFEEDREALLEAMNVTEAEIRVDRVRINDNAKKHKQFYSQVPRDLVEKLYELFKLDFDMLGYPKPNISAYYE